MLQTGEELLIHELLQPGSFELGQAVVPTRTVRVPRAAPAKQTPASPPWITRQIAVGWPPRGYGASPWWARGVGAGQDALAGGVGSLLAGGSVVFSWRSGRARLGR